MIDVEFELKKSVIKALKESLDMAEVGGRVYDFLPENEVNPESPYIVMGSWVTTSDDAECIDGYLVQMSIDVYSYGPNEHGSSALVSKLSSAVRKTLKTEEFELMPDYFAAISHRATRLLKDSRSPVQRSNIAMEASFDEGKD